MNTHPSKNPAICVYCGAQDAVAQHYLDTGDLVGSMLAEAGYNVVFGGGNCGMMGKVSNAALNKGGHVTGVFPKHLDQFEVRHDGVSELVLVENMHERKQTMFDLSDAFAILPGGFGTMDEMFEIITWHQIGLHEKPLVILNYNGYWDHLIALMEHFIEEKFAKPKNRSFYRVASTPEELIHTLSTALAKKNNISA